MPKVLPFRKKIHSAKRSTGIVGLHWWGRPTWQRPERAAAMLQSMPARLVDALTQPGSASSELNLDTAATTSAAELPFDDPL
jgi:hypothetical protein